MKNNYSVLMSVYYREKPEFLEQSVLSVMNQSVKPNDFVLVCDGPLTDELNNMIANLKARFTCLNIVRLEENKGLGEALSIGINHTKNEIVMRMDSDDICLPNRAEIELPLMEKYDLVGGFISEFENNPENIIGHRKTPETYEQIIKYAKKRNPFNHPTVMFRKEKILEAGNYKTLLYLEDYYLWVRLLQKTNKVYNVQQVLVNMRSGREMRARRSNKIARKSIRTLRKTMYKMGMISWFSYVWYSCVYTIFMILPIGMRQTLYSKVLRK